ncbi:hypothetical protein Salat_2607100 [Sesamum alatum]|uniref:Secreted protein n=1 Tax=Sesamum alatum TaxID=300844 RepID=A0AAE1XN73_9LAMI|nr:hypothetical protein Salat_2607100 [Sesamum alatum]
MVPKKWRLARIVMALLASHVSLPAETFSIVKQCAAALQPRNVCSYALGATGAQRRFKRRIWAALGGAWRRRVWRVVASLESSGLVVAAEATGLESSGGLKRQSWWRVWNFPL